MVTGHSIVPSKTSCNGRNELVLPECKGRGSGGEQYKQVVGVPVHCIRLVALERRAVGLLQYVLYLHHTCETISLGEEESNRIS